ncbi:hypothetical protein SUGI_0684140 [Cryptomeria japonica]|uniref:uncharacterized protein LOC131045062 isoform X2 n=1 Tax=Cryptomeria japonica TaxID=3369 RepID=UPI0024147859|nr:uncharacterized protein LOC131045062 isoform X2 [Cryptomeria japonica]GLJ34015.1 hypothetical protein SUGI_0684140 [Cryptomeria japonica]
MEFTEECSGSGGWQNNNVKEQFEELVLKWTLHDITNGNLYHHKVDHIPERFTSVGEYLGSFVWPLIEEMRAKLQQSLESICQAQYAIMKFQEKTQLSEGVIGTYEMLIDRENDTGDNKEKENLKLKSMDILMLSKKLPENLDYLYDDYLLALVHRTDYDDTTLDELTVNVKVKAYVRYGHPFTSTNYNMNTKYFAFNLSSIISCSRIWNALHTHLGVKEQSTAMLCKAIYLNREDYYEACAEVKEDDFEKFRSKHFMPHNFNDSQASAVFQAVNAIESTFSSDIKLIQGPPGTGKTSTLISLLSILVHKQFKVLVCAPTNAAVSEVAMRFINIVKSPSGCCPDTDKFPCVLNLSDLLLVGNEERFDPKGIFRDIFLTYRVDRLSKCFLPMTGWRHRVISLLDFLQLAASQYEVFQQAPQETGLIDFSEYIKQTLKKLTSEFYEGARTLLNDLPGALSGKQELECLIDIVQSFVNLIEDNKVKERVLRECFCSNSEGVGETEGLTGKFNENMLDDKQDLKVILYMKRCECIQLLRKHLSGGTDIACLTQKFILTEGIEKMCTSHAKLVFSTVSSSAKRCMNVAASFDCLIIDEAAQLTEAESTIALQIRGLRHAILIGDPNQLAETVISKISQEAGYGRSLFERLQHLGHPFHLLNTQYRMHPLICQFPNMEFYGNCIINGPNVKKEPYGIAHIKSEMYGTYAFINIQDGKEEEDESSMSKRNIVEAAVVMHILSKLYKVCASRKGLKISVGVISPYNAQVSYLESRLMKKDEWKNTIDVEVKSVDGFQGGEKDIIIISTVRTENIGFLSDHRRANVALTRARFCLWIVGNGSMLVKSKSVWENIAKDAIARKCFLDPSVDSGIVKVIRNAKAEMNQLQDLLKKDSVLFNNTIWKVMFSNEFKESFTKLKGLNVRQQIINTILKLANGWRQSKKHAGSPQENLINEYATSGLYLVWTTDVERGEEVCQILKIWNILSHVEVPNLRQRLENVFTTYTQEYIARCKAILLDKDAKTVLPRRWKYDPGFVWYRHLQQPEMVESLHCETLDKETITLEHAKVEESLLLMKFYSLSSGIANQLLTAKDGSEIDLQFEVNEEESRIIRFPRSSFILGRSGTGKTTVLTTKLLQKEHQFYLATHGFSWENPGKLENTLGRKDLQQDYINSSCLRQMFVTVSAKLCSAIRNRISRIDSFIQGKDLTPHQAIHDSSDSLQDFQNIPDSFIDIDDKHFPMVITFQKFLTMLDGSVRSQFFQNRCPEEQGYQMEKKDDCSNDNIGKEVGLTKSGSNCKDFDDDGEATEILDDQELFIGAKRSMHTRSLAFMQIMRKNEVNYECFDSVYWPHFNVELRRGLDSSVVFTEIVSHIKGSLKSLSSPDFKLSRDDYIGIAESRVSTLCVKQREAIYDIFLQYEKQKQKNSNFDIADVVNHLHHQIRSNGYLGEKMNFVYVDEVQDLPMAQISLFKYVCSNVREGFIFAGDTAQTIARGVYFRFEDIRNLFFKEFLEVDNDQSKTKLMPDLFHLSQNFRTHTGITKLAQSVVELLYHFFPFAVDKLRPETSLIYGEAPTFLDTKEEESVITTIFGHGGNIGSGKYEFGAEQAILVRDDDQKIQVLEQVGKQSLVLTILECKGLEFQDVLLYNFFSSSPLGMKWRVIYDFMEQKGFNSCEQCQYPKFDNIKHNLLCSEVKHLYVAITRSKQRLWIYDENAQYTKPMLDYWKRMGIVRFRCLDKSMVESMHVVSSCDDWKQRGIQMFNEKNYDMAVICFEKSGDVNMAKWAEAARLREDGQRNFKTHKEIAKHLLTVAANMFLSIEKPESAANCFIIMGEYKEAGRIYVEKCDERRLQDAGDCFAEAKCWHNAAGAYARANCISKCLNACIKGKIFETGLEFIQVLQKENCKSNCGKCEICEGVKLETEYLKMCATHFHQKKDSMSMMKFVKAFPTMDLIRSFLSSKDYFDELLGIEEANGNYFEAAEVAGTKGDLLLEVVMLEKARNYEQAIKSIQLHVWLNSLWGMGNEGWPLQHFPGKNKLLEKIKQIANQNLLHIPKVLVSLDCEASMFSSQSQSLSELAEQIILSHQMRNVKFEVVSLRKVLDVHLRSDVKTFEHDEGVSSFERVDSSKMLLENRVSSTTMMFIWNSWKDKVLSSVYSLLKLEKHQEREEDKIYIEFACEYFGTRVNRNNRFCTVFNSEAFWLKGRRLELLQRRGNCAQISIQNFAMHAKEFLLMELFSVGDQVLKKIQQIYLSCTNQHCILTVEGTLIIQIYQVSKALEDKLLAGFGQVTSLIGIENLVNRFFEIFFPLKAQYENVKKFISLRENPTSSLILKDMTLNIISKMHGGLTLGQIGRLQVMLPFLHKDLVTEYGKEIVKSLQHNDCWNNVLLWLHMETLTGNSFQDKRLNLIESFATALYTTFQHWQNQSNYISPHIFLSLLEKLFFFSSSCEYRSGGLFLPRIFFVELMTGEQGTSSCAWFLQSSSLPGCQGRLEKFYHPMHDIILQLLVTSKADTFTWMKAFKIDSRIYFPEMATRLIIMLCLMGVNSIGMYQNAMYTLSSIFRDTNIRKNLPPKFGGKLHQFLQKNKTSRDAFLTHFSRLMRDIDNPLVMIDSVKSPKLESCTADFIVLGPESINYKEILLQSIFRDEGDMIALNERDGDMKSKELVIQGKMNMLPSKSNSFETNTKHLSGTLKYGESFCDSAESHRDKQDKGNAHLKSILGSSSIDQQKRSDSLGVDSSFRDKNAQFSLLEDHKTSCKFEVDDQSLASSAPSHLEETLSIKEKYIQEACRVFQGIQNTSYIETFILKACPLKAEVDEFVDLIKTAIPKVKQRKVFPNEEIDLSEEMHHIREELLHLSGLLHPRHEKHKECDAEWLENDVISHTSTRLQESRDRLNRFKFVFEDNTQADTQCIQTVQSKNKQKIKNKPKGHKKGGKRRK